MGGEEGPGLPGGRGQQGAGLRQAEHARHLRKAERATYSLSDILCRVKKHLRWIYKHAVVEKNYKAVSQGNVSVS